MRRILRFFTQRWLISLIGLGALMLLIYLGGQHIKIANYAPLGTDFNKLLACSVLLFLWGISNVRTRLRSIKSNAELIHQLAAAPEPKPQTPSASDEEVATLKQRFDDALRSLERTGVKGRFGKRNLYQLPWYVIIGPPGSGKTTMVENSDLDFPLSANEQGGKRIAGVGGTRNCDWWFTNEAVLLDTAGRYTTQDSHVDTDSAGWTGFLDLLKQTRPRRPLNGIIIAVSLGELQTEFEQQRVHHANTIRQRILEIYDRLGMRLPIYLVLTKCDLVAGFTEFFDDLPREHRHQVWGMSFPDYASDRLSDATHQFDSEFDLLIQGVGDLVVKRLQEERDHHRRGIIFCFPQQLTNLKPVLSEFIQSTFQTNNYEETPWLRGVYLTSGTQEGSPIDRVMATIASTFNINAMSLPRLSGNARSFFIHRLLRDVIFREAELAGTNRRYENTRHWLHRGSWIAVGTVTTALIAVWGFGFLNNSNYTSKLIGKIDAFDESRGNFDSQSNILTLLDTLDRAEAVKEIGSNPPALWGIGVYQGFKTENASERAYRSALNGELLRFIRTSLETDILRLSSNGADNVDTAQAYTLLSTYLMLGESAQFHKDQFKSWVERDWSDLPVDKSVVNDLKIHLASMLESEVPVQALDEVTLTHARQMICQTPIESQIYARLEDKARSLPNIDTFGVGNLPTSLRPLLARTESNVRALSVPNFYLRPAAEMVLNDGIVEASIRRVISEYRNTCVDNTTVPLDTNIEAIRRGIQSRYYREYTNRWTDFLESLELAPLTDIAEAGKALNALTAADRPLHELIKDITQHTNFTALANTNYPGRELTEKISDVLSTNDFIDGPNPIESHFAPLNQLLVSEGESDPLIDDVNRLLIDLDHYIESIGKSSNVAENAYQNARRRMTNDQADVFNEIISLAKVSPVPISNILEATAKESWGTVLVEAKRHINAVWLSTAYRSCVDHIADRYPVNRSSDRDIALRDFGTFFGIGGDIENFTNEYLKPFIDSNRWQSKILDDKQIPFDAAFIQQMKNARTIQKTYFSNEDKRPTASFHIRPVELSANTHKSILRLHGQNVIYDHGPRVEYQIKWPGPEESGDVQLYFEDTNYQNSPMLRRTGPWAWFRLLDIAKPSSQTRTETTVEFRIERFQTQYRIRADSDNNPFTGELDAVNRFRCPENT